MRRTVPTACPHDCPDGGTPERFADYGRAPTFSDTLVEVSAIVS